MSRVVPLGILFAVAIPGAWAGAPREAQPPKTPAANQDPSSQAAPAPLTDAEKEEFLLKAQVVKRKTLATGITGSKKAILRLGSYEHDAHIQTIDEYKTQTTLTTGMEIDFRDSWKNNVAAYRLDRALGIGWVPVTVARRDEMKMAAFTWWVDDVLMTEKDRYQKKIKSPDTDAWNHQIFVVRLFDQLIYNVDRNLGNLLIDKDWRVWMIDHTRAFKIFKDLRKEGELGTSCARTLLPALRRLDKPTLKPLMDGLLTDGQIEAMLARRDHIVRYFDAKMAAMGEGAVLYDLPPRQVAATAVK